MQKRKIVEEKIFASNCRASDKLEAHELVLDQLKDRYASELHKTVRLSNYCFFFSSKYIFIYVYFNFNSL